MDAETSATQICASQAAMPLPPLKRMPVNGGKGKAVFAAATRLGRPHETGKVRATHAIAATRAVA